LNAFLGIFSDMMEPPADMRTLAEQYRWNLRQVPGFITIYPLWDAFLIRAFVHVDADGKKPISLPPALQDLPQTIHSYLVRLDILYSLPPPSGVVVLRANGTQEVAEQCPESLTEVEVLDWRFCADGTVPLPAAMAPPIANVPFERAFNLIRQPNNRLRKIPGVAGLLLGEDAIYVITPLPELLSQTSDGLPVKVGLPPKVWWGWGALSGVGI
jgi:hypothetical protein